MRVVISSPADAIVAGMACTGHPGPVYVTRLDGWSGTPAPQGEPVALPVAGGAAWPVRITQSSRVVTVGIHARCATGLEAAQLCDRLAALAGQRLTLEVSDEGGTRSAGCLLSDAVSPVVGRGGSRVDADLVLTCPDPLRYGPEQVVEGEGGAFSALVGGTAPTWPVFRFSGPVTAFTLASGGHSVSWEGTGPVTLDTRDMVPSTGTLSADDGFAVGPGRAYVSYSATGATGATMTVRPAWR